MNYPYLVSFKRSLFSLIFSCLFFGLAFAFGLPTLSQPAFAAAEPATGGPITISPRDDFPGWYAQWLKHFPRGGTETHTEYDTPKDKPSVLKVSRIGHGDYRLIVFSKLKNKSKMRFIQNEKYFALIQSTDSKTSPWIILNFTSREQASDFSAESLETQKDFGSGIQDFLGPNLKHFKHASLTEDSISGTAGNRIKKLVFTFDINIAQAKRNGLTELTLFLNEGSGWMPSKAIAKSDKAGQQTTFQTLFKGWSLVEKVWRYQQAEIYIENILQLKIVWDFSTIGNTLSEDTAECYLSHYGLPEPKVAGSSYWWVKLFLVLLLSGVGYRLLK